MKIKRSVSMIVLVGGLLLLLSLTALGQEQPAAPVDNVIYDDLIVAGGSACIGFDCANGENFGFDTLRLKENNLRIHFDDTSTSGSFPRNDWRITINDSASGGNSYFRIDDATNNISTLTIRAHGKVGIGTDDPAEKLHVAGNVQVDGSVSQVSDVNAKRDFAAVDGATVLSRLSRIPITTWSYKQDSPDVRHMGPTAQDFYAAFELGRDERHISTLDANGVAFAAIQELYQQVQAKDARIAELEQLSMDLARQNKDMEARLTALESAILSLQGE